MNPDIEQSYSQSIETHVTISVVVDSCVVVWSTVVGIVVGTVC